MAQSGTRNEPQSSLQVTSRLSITAFTPYRQLFHPPGLGYSDVSIYKNRSDGILSVSDSINDKMRIRMAICKNSGINEGIQSILMTSSNCNNFRVTGPLCVKSTGHRWIPHAKAGDAELWGFLWSLPWINGWVNNREAGDLRHHRAHCDVTVMCMAIFTPHV